MTTRGLTPLLALSSEVTHRKTLREKLFQVAFGAIQWPWLLKSLYGGSRASKRRLLDRLALEPSALPHLGSWKADTYLLHRLVDLIEDEQPRVVVELGCGATSLVIARALAQNGNGGTLYSYDQNSTFVAQVGAWLASYDLPCSFHHAPLSGHQPGWPGQWYELAGVPDKIDLLIIDGPPWSVHPFVRGAAEALFPRLSGKGVIVLDDAARPGERYIARVWRRNWPDIEFDLEHGGSKGTLVGRRR